MRIKCGSCKGQHESVAAVRECYGHLPATHQPQFIDQERLREKAAVQAREREEDERVAAYKAQRDSRDSQHYLTNGGDRRTDIPDGRYALEGADKVVRFYKVNTNQKATSRWYGVTFLTFLIGSPGDFREVRLPRGEREQVLKTIASDPQSAAALFGRKTKHCGRCMSPLTTPQSRAAGYGEICAEKIGWSYPSLSEALAALGEK